MTTEFLRLEDALRVFATTDETQGQEHIRPVHRYLSLRLVIEMAGRRFVRNDYTRYESVGLALVENGKRGAGSVHGEFPAQDSPLRIERFFSRLYEVYDLRFPFRGESVAAAFRKAWSPESPVFRELGEVPGRLGYSPRLGD